MGPEGPLIVAGLRVAEVSASKGKTMGKLNKSQINKTVISIIKLRWLMWVGKKIYGVFELIAEKPVLAALIILVVLGLIVLKISFPLITDSSRGFRENILPEGFGVVFDIFVFGILIALFSLIGEKRRDIRRWQEEINDYRGWDEKEAMYRIVGNINRLYNKGVIKIKLYKCFLVNAYLSGANLQKADLRGAKKLIIEQLSTAKTLYMAKLDPELEQQVREKYPHLLEKPKEEE